MPRKLYSFTNYFWFAAGTGLMLLTPLAVAIVLNRSGSPEHVGLYALAYAVTAPIQAFLGLHARTFIAIDRLYGFHPADLAAQRLHMAAGLFLGAGAVAGLRRFDPEELAIFLAMCLVRVAEGLAEVSAGIVQRQHRPEPLALVYGLRAVVGIGVFASLYPVFGLPLALTAMACVSFAAFVLIDRPLLSRIGAPLDWSRMIESAVSSRPIALSRRLLPAGLVILLSVIETNLPRYVVEGRAGIVELGMFTSVSFVLYAATNMVVPVFQMTIAPLGQAAARNDAEGARRATHIVVVNLLISAIAGVILIAGVGLAGTQAMTWGLGPQYAGQGPLLTALGVAAAVGMMRSCLGFLLTGLDAIRALSVMSAGNMVLFGLLVSLSAGDQGVVGIAWAWALASATTTVAGLGVAAARLWRLRRAGLLVAGIQGA